MTINQSLSWAQKKLNHNIVETRHCLVSTRECNLDAEILLSFVLKKDKAFLYSHPENSINNKQLTRYKKYINRRAKGEPIAYLIGHKEFYGLDFYINKNVLVPRPETELMVEQVLKQLSIISNQQSAINNQQQTILIDIGTGSGCIPISILKNLPVTRYALPITYFATDISKPALTVARKNAKLHNLDKKIKFLNGNLLEPMLKNKKYVRMFQCSNVIMTCNLPYLPNKIYKQNYNQLKYEPLQSLIAKNNGLEFYKKLIVQIKSLVTRYSLRVTILLEILPIQTKPLTKIIKKHFPKAKISIKKDLAGLNRLIMLHLPISDNKNK